VRYGKRGDITGWLHRDPDVDHLPLFGELWTPEKQQAAMDAIATRLAEKKGAKAADDDDEVEHWDEVPEPYVTAQPVGPEDFPPRSGIRQIHNLATKTPGWDVVDFTLAIGPYVGGRGQVLSISDSVKMVLGGPEVDSGRRVAVASWRDGAFDFAYTGILKGSTVYTEPANSNALKAWIKEPLP